MEPYTFKCVRTEVLRAEMLVRQFLASKHKAAHGANDVPPCLDVGAVPFHRLEFVMSKLHDTVGVLAAFERATVRRHDAIVRRRSFVDKHDENSSL